MKHIKIGVDMDDVLIEFNQEVYAYINKKLGTQHDPSQQVVYHIREAFGINREDEYDLVTEFYNSLDHFETLPVLGAIDAISHLKKYTLILISARPLHATDISVKWLEKHFPSIFSHVILTDEYQRNGAPRKGKGELAKELRLNAFIEDSLAQAIDISQAGVPVVLLDKRWNQGELPENIYRVNTWEEAKDRIQQLVS